MDKVILFLQRLAMTHTRIPASWINLYSITGFIFLIWISFIDSHSLIDRYKLNQTINKLEQDKLFYKAEIQTAKQDRLDLDLNKEKYAREKYFMHKPNEEVFIIERAE